MPAPLTRAERMARARAALNRAEERTGARSLPRGGRPASEAGEAGEAGEGRTAAAGTPETRTQGSAALAVVPDPPAPAPRVSPEPVRPTSPEPVRAAQRASVLLTARPPLPVPEALTPLLPDGLRRGQTTAVLGSTSLVLAMIAAACTAREAWAAVVGQPSLGLLAAAQAGVGLDRLAVVPQPGPDAPTVLAALLDGIDVVVVGPGVRLQDADRRRLMARARDRGSVLLPTVPWPGAGCVLTVEGGRWTGVGSGDGRLRAHELHLTRTGRGAAGGRAEELRIVLPFEAGTDPYGVAADPGGIDGSVRQGEPRAGELRLVG